MLRDVISSLNKQNLSVGAWKEVSGFEILWQIPFYAPKERSKNLLYESLHASCKLSINTSFKQVQPKITCDVEFQKRQV